MAHLPVIPDLRFESSYIRSIRRYIDIERVPGSAPAAEHGSPTTEVELLAHYETIDASVDEKGNLEVKHKKIRESEIRELQPASSGPREIIRVQWKSVIWVTVRDQVISPLLQGALWALASYYITPFSSQLGSRMGTFVHDRIPTKEGLGVTWLRNWAKNIGFSDHGNNSDGHSQRTPNPSSYRY